MDKINRTISVSSKHFHDSTNAAVQLTSTVSENGNTKTRDNLGSTSKSHQSGIGIKSYSSKTVPPATSTPKVETLKSVPVRGSKKEVNSKESLHKKRGLVKTKSSLENQGMFEEGKSSRTVSHIKSSPRLKKHSKRTLSKAKISHERNIASDVCSGFDVGIKTAVQDTAISQSSLVSISERNESTSEPQTSATKSLTVTNEIAIGERENQADMTHKVNTNTSGLEEVGIITAQKDDQATTNQEIPKSDICNQHYLKHT